MWLTAMYALHLVSHPQEAPVTGFRWMLPLSGDVQARYSCATDVTFRLSFDGNAVRILSYSGSAGEATPEEITQWNAWLEPIGAIDFYDFSCLNSNEKLDIQGRHRRENRPASVAVYWHEGKMKRYRDAYEPLP